MNSKFGIGGSLVDLDGNLVFPEVNEKDLNEKLENNKKVETELIEFFKKADFSKERINELLQFKKNLEDLKLLERIERKTELLSYLKEQNLEIEKYKNKE